MNNTSGSEVVSSFGYPIRSEKEVGFYVVCSDRMILDNVNALLKKKGLVGISDTAGRIHYMVDARTNIYAAVNHITREALRKIDLSSLSNANILDATEETLSHHHLDRTLLGTRILRCILLQSVRDPSLLTIVSKRLYPLAAKEFGISTSQVERNLRYALGRTLLHQDGLRNVHIIQRLFDDISALLTARFGVQPYIRESSHFA